MTKATILLVDGDLDMLLIGQRIFGRANYKFISARNGREGLEKLVHNKPDLIITEFILPDIDGKQFIETIACDDEYAEFRQIPIIILTTRSDYLEDFDRFYQMGLRAYLTKPFGHRELVTIVENLIRLSQMEQRQKRVHQAADAQSPAPKPAETVQLVLDNVQTGANTICGLCRSILANETDFISERQKMDLQAIQNSGRRLLRMVKEIYS